MIGWLMILIHLRSKTISLSHVHVMIGALGPCGAAIEQRQPASQAFFT